MAQIKHIVIICGEPSGDLNAAALAREILKLSPETGISGVGGPLLRSAGACLYYDIKELSSIGLFDVLKKLPRYFGLKKLILRKISQDRPDAVILVDFSGFNLRLAKAINKSLPVVYYVSPQVWASRPGRTRTIKEFVHKMVVLFKFEQEFYKKYGIEADFAGHPLLDTVRPTMDKLKFMHKFGLDAAGTTIALLAGSREQEIKNILPVMLKAALLIRQKMNKVQFVIAKHPQLDWDIFKNLLKGVKLDCAVIEGKAYDCLNIADFALIASGTATLEAAIMQKPFAVIYKMSLLNYLLYRPQVKIPYISIVNILAGKRVVPEFIQFGARPERIADYALKILINPPELQRIKDSLAQVKSSLGEKGASSRAASLILSFLKTEGHPSS